MKPVAPERTRADHEADRGLPVLQDQQQDRDRHRDGGDDRVLAVQVGLGPLLDGAGDFPHAVVARGLREQALGDDKSIDDGGASADERDDDSVIGKKVGQVPIPPVVLAARESIDEGGDTRLDPLWKVMRLRRVQASSEACSPA